MIENKTEQNLPENLLALITQEVKNSLSLVARSCELAGSQNNSDSSAAAINNAQQSVDAALKQIEGYRLGLKLANLGQGELALEPLATSSIFHEVSTELAELARVYGIELELETPSKASPILANRQVLSTALISLGCSLIEALSSHDDKQLTLRLSYHRTKFGVVAGWYWQAEGVTNELLDRGRDLVETSQQPITALSHTQSSGIFVADLLLSSMNSRLTTNRYHNWTGVATLLQPSHQLSLV